MSLSGCATGYEGLNGTVWLYELGENDQESWGTYGRAKNYYIKGLKRKGYDQGISAPSELYYQNLENIKNISKLVKECLPFKNKCFYFINLAALIYMIGIEFSETLVAATEDEKKKIKIREDVDYFFDRVAILNLLGETESAMPLIEFLISVRLEMDKACPGHSYGTVLKVISYAIEHPALLTVDIGMLTGQTEDRGQGTDLKASISCLEESHQKLVHYAEKMISLFCEKTSCTFSKYMKEPFHPRLMYPEKILTELSQICENEINVLKELSLLSITQIATEETESKIRDVHIRISNLLRPKGRLGPRFFPKNSTLLIFFSNQLLKIEQVHPESTAIFELRDFLPPKLRYRYKEYNKTRSLQELRTIYSFINDAHHACAYLNLFAQHVLDSIKRIQGAMYRWHRDHKSDVINLLAIAAAHKEASRKEMEEAPASSKIKKRKIRKNRRKKMRVALLDEPSAAIPAPREKSLSLLNALSQEITTSVNAKRLAPLLFQLQFLLQKYDEFSKNPKSTFLSSLLFLESSSSFLEQFLSYYQPSQEKISHSSLEPLKQVSQWNKSICTYASQVKREFEQNRSKIPALFYNIFLLSQNEQEFEGMEEANDMHLTKTFIEIFENMVDFSSTFFSNLAKTEARKPLLLDLKQNEMTNYNIMEEEWWDRVDCFPRMSSNDPNRDDAIALSKDISLDITILKEIHKELTGKIPIFYFPILIQKNIQLLYSLVERVVKIVYLVKKHSLPQEGDTLCLLWKQVAGEGKIQEKELQLLETYFNEFPQKEGALYVFSEHHPFQTLIMSARSIESKKKKKSEGLAMKNANDLSAFSSKLVELIRSTLFSELETSF